MGRMNLLRGSWDGKVGQTVGSKWKNKATIRVYAQPSNPDTAGQKEVRKGFKAMSGYFALFTDQLKRLSALDTRGMSLRNALIKLNSDEIKSDPVVPSKLKLSRGGLPNVSALTNAWASGLANTTFTWAKVVAPTVSDDAKLVVVMANAVEKQAFVAEAMNEDQTITVAGPFKASTAYDVFWYILDPRGSSKVASPSGYMSKSSPAS